MNGDDNRTDLIVLNNRIQSNRKDCEHDLEQLDLALIVERARAHDLSLRIASLEARLEKLETWRRAVVTTFPPRKEARKNRKA